MRVKGAVFWSNLIWQKQIYIFFLCGSLCEILRKFRLFFCLLMAQTITVDLTLTIRV